MPPPPRTMKRRCTPPTPKASHLVVASLGRTNRLRSMIVVEGHTLTGMAVAARLARLGHDVTLTGDDVPRAPLDHIELPAAWRDLCTKTGRPLAGTLGSVGLTLAPAPPVTYLLPCGTELTLPDERGGQYAAIRSVFGKTQAERWRDLLDELDDVWAALRRFGLEAPTRPTTPDARRALWLHRTLADVADRADRMAPIILAEASLAGTRSPNAPGILAVRQTMTRTFGRHRLVDDQHRTADATVLITLLERRLDERFVRRTPSPPSPVTVDARPHLPWALWRRPRPALVPTLTPADPGPAAEIMDLTGSAPLRIIRGEHHATCLDYRHATPSIAAGIAPDDARRWLRRPTPNAHRSSAACIAGGEPWAELLSAALTVYALHEELTGEDCRPTNRNFHMPPVRRER